jgi:KUP system potassium uptake protein
MGVVFGDLGTSPLYALQDAFNSNYGITCSAANVLGVISLFLWSLIIIVCIKYVAVLMRADNRGEGGILALLSLLIAKGHGRRVGVWVMIALLGTAMLYGDGVITPAISVLSAMEGLQVATSAFIPYILPLTVIILLLLFIIQPLGTGRIGFLFGTILALWFGVIAVLGVCSVWKTPEVLWALDPLCGVKFFIHHGVHGLITLGSVVLCITGVEAFYADMGHFGPLPIRVAWYGVALPSLMLNYLGQGALLLRLPQNFSHPFFSLVPSWAIYFIVILAAAATIVASQALITALFSLTHQAVQLYLSPRVKIIHTSNKIIGQIYLPVLNWLLMLATITVVFIFRTSDNLAAAYGFAVSVTMAMTTVLLLFFLRLRWAWSYAKIAFTAGVFLLIDLAFVVANALKFFEGAWFTVALGFGVFLLMATWYFGHHYLIARVRHHGIPLLDFLENLKNSSVIRVKGTAVFLAQHVELVPKSLLHQLKHNQVLHERVILLTITNKETPVVESHQRLEITELPMNIKAVVANFGFKEKPFAMKILHDIAKKENTPHYDLMSTTFFLGKLNIMLSARHHGISAWLLNLFLWMRRNENDATQYFGLPPDRVVALGSLVVF